MKKYYSHSLLTITALFIISALSAQDTIILNTAGAGTWMPLPGTKTFYAQLWAGGAAGNSVYGGGGGGFAQSTVFTVAATSFTNGYSYNVGAGGSNQADGQDTRFGSCYAYRGLSNNQGTNTYNDPANIAFSYHGGAGGQNYQSVFGNWGGGGGGSAYSTGNGYNGENAPFGTNGRGGGGTGQGGDGGYNGYAPGGGGGIGGNGASGQIKIIYTCDYTPGTIGNAHTVPYPAELPYGSDSITNVQSPAGFGFTYSWEQSTDNVNWTTVTGAINATLIIPEILQDTWYRRVIDGCDPAKNRSNAVKITVFSLANGKKNGTISGRVTSKNGIGVGGITITAKKSVPLKGSPANYEYDTTTDANGNYSLKNVYYGDALNGDPGIVNFIITPSKQGHTFLPVNVNSVNLSTTDYKDETGNDFTDNTVYGIAGRITQYCFGCLQGYTGPFGVGNIQISADDPKVFTVNSDSLRADSIGYFGITVADPKNYKFTPLFLNHKFSPKDTTINVLDNVTNVNFSDTTTRLISGKLIDAGGKRIGAGSLIFEGVYQRKDSIPITTFKKRATINTNDSTYSVRVPAGSYKVTVETFIPAYSSPDKRYIVPDSVTNFFNKWAVESLIDVSMKDSVRNLVYHRPPVIILTGLKDTACNQNPTLNPGIIFRTNSPKHFKINVFEGDSSLGNRVQIISPYGQPDTLADYIRVFTDITERSASANADTIFFRLKNAPGGAMLDSSFFPGAPNTVPIVPGDYSKHFEVHYIDRYGRKATPLKPKATVVGVFNPAQTFTTAFPEVPFLILHAPPGDQSYSYWSKDSSTTTTKSWYVGSENGKDGFVNVSLGPTASFESPLLGVGFDVDIIATGNYTHEDHVNTGENDELESTITATEKFQTSKSLKVTGNSGDVYIGNGTNYKLGNSTYVDFNQDVPVGACEIKKDIKLIMGVDTFRTEFAYAEDHIVNVIIPQQEKISKEATDPVKRAEAATQVSVWQQVIENNKQNKIKAKTVKNRSFSHGVIIDESQTSSKSITNTITYDVLLANDIAFELGLRVANVGVSGGGMITMKETSGNATTLATNSTTTMGYHLEDDDIGDFYSVNIKEDPVYKTPVFDLVAGTSSCPAEEGAQNRDQPQIISGNMNFDGLNVNSPKFFNITLTNKSESGEPRDYVLSVDAATSDGLIISSSSSNNLAENGGAVTFYQIPYEGTQNVQIKVVKFNPDDKVFSYPNVEFYLTDNCGVLPVPNTISTARISFNYSSPCGNIALAAPLDGWIANTGNNNTLPITMNGYTLSNIDSITLQYKKQDTLNFWQRGFTIKKAAITDSVSYTYPWNIADLKDTVYNLRLRLICQNGDIIYSNVIAGITDRKAPSLVGKPLPATQLYSQGNSEIVFAYDENIDNTNLNQGAVEMIRRSNNSPVPVSVNEADGKLIITPLNDLGTTIDSFRVIVKNISDLYGNVKAKPDTSFFNLDLTPLLTYTGSNVATVHVVTPAIAENSTGSMELHFKLREKVNKITRVYFNLSGTALYNTDYTISYDTIQQKKCARPACDSFVYLQVLNQFSGASSYVNIDSNNTEAVIYIYPIADFENEGDETIRVNLVSGADYKLQDSVLAIATILKSTSPCPQGNILYVNRNATGNNSGVSWQNAMTSLIDALNSTCPGITQIWVAKGTYKPTINNSRDSAFFQKNNLTIYGGFAGTETLLSQRNWRANPTILSGDIGVANDNSDNSYNVIRNVDNGLNSTAILDGFIVKGGNANKGDYTGNRGGAVHNRNSTPAYYNCIFTGNNAAEYGGAMFNQNTAPLVMNSVFNGNTALYGGGLYNESASTIVINSSFSGNQVIVTGAAVYTYGAVVPQITNSILWGNNSTAIQNAGGALPAVTYSIVEGNYTGTGNLNIDPLFILQPTPGLANAADLRLQGCSPAMNAGSNAALPAGITTDLAGLSRIANTVIDIGAYERQNPAQSTTIYVDAAATGNNSGESWANAYTNLSSALTELNYCAPGTTIQIAAGVYTAPVNSTYNFDKAGAIILGGYPAGGGNRNALVNSTILIGEVKVLKSLQMDGVKIQKQ